MSEPTSRPPGGTGAGAEAGAGTAATAEAEAESGTETGGRGGGRAATGGTPLPPPSDYRLAVPEGWQRILLDPERWERRIDRLVADAFRGVDDQPHLRRQAAGQMKDRAAAAHANGGVEMYLSLTEVGGVPLPAGLVVTVIAPEPGGPPLPDPDTIGVARGAEGADVSMVDLPAGPALRHRYRERPRENDPSGNKLPVTHLDFELAVPNSPLHLLLSFSTSMDPLADVLVELFDAIASTLQWMA